MIEIDGSFGEGGGQILRTAVALAVIVGKPVRVYNIRAKRSNPGLRPQHMAALKALAEISDAEVKGLHVGSTEVVFKPRTIKPGRYRINIGTAGSVTLVLQALLPVLAYSPGPVELEVVGGTDVPWSPPIDYVRAVLLWFLKILGYNVQLEVIRRGHYPKGGGVVRVKIQNPPRGFRSIDLTERGEINEVHVYSHATNLPRHVAERQARAVENRLRAEGIKCGIVRHIEWKEKGAELGPGSGVVVVAYCKHSVLGGDALGAKGKRAEVVGTEAAEELIEDLETNAALDRHMSDMIIPYLSLADGTSRISGARLTMHAFTVIHLVRKILGVGIQVEGSLEKPFKATIKGIGLTA